MTKSKLTVLLSDYNTISVLQDLCFVVNFIFILYRKNSAWPMRRHSPTALLDYAIWYVKVI